MKLNWTIPGAVAFPPIVLPVTPANPLGAWRTYEKNPPHYGIMGTYSTPAPILAVGYVTQNRVTATPYNPAGVYKAFNDMASKGGS